MSKQELSKSKDESQDQINFYDIRKTEKTEKDGEIKFTLEKGKTIITSDCIRIADPSYDCVFKTIFGEGNKCNGIDGNARLLNLLNSLIFPQQNDKNFIEVVSVSNEKSKINIDNKNSGILRFDISCKATLYDNINKKQKIVNIEMQLGKKTGLIDRMINYAYSLYNMYKTETILITFMNQNYINNDNNSKYLQQSFYNPKGEKIQDLENIEIIFVNLKEEINQYIEMKRILIKNKELDKTGISWLKLLGIRQWAQKSKFYYLPQNVIFPSKELESAFILLQNYDEKDLFAYMRIEEEDNNILTLYKEEGKKEGKNEGDKKRLLLTLINIFRNKTINFDEMINIIDFEKTTFKTKDIVALIGDNTEKDDFIKMLGKKRKIE